MSQTILWLAFVMSSISANATASPARSVEHAGVRLEWVIRDAQLHGCMQAVTRGWVTVGFNTQSGLGGARLVMGRMMDGRAQAQVHIAKPPQHIHRLTQDGKERVSHVSGSLSLGVTRICFSMPLAASDAEDVNLIAGRDTHVIMAWSNSSDFQHHSTQRGAVQVVL
jgi:DOMON domain